MMFHKTAWFGVHEITSNFDTGLDLNLRDNSSLF